MDDDIQMDISLKLYIPSDFGNPVDLSEVSKRLTEFSSSPATIALSTPETIAPSTPETVETQIISRPYPFPFLKKYKCSERIKDLLMKDDNLEYLFEIHNTVVEIVSIENNKLILRIDCDEYDGKIINFKIGFLKDFFTFHLSNADLLPFFKENIKNGKRIFFRFNCSQKRLTHGDFHQDSVLFILLQYFNYKNIDRNYVISNDPVYGTDLLLTQNPGPHRYVDKIEKNYGKSYKYYYDVLSNVLKDKNYNFAFKGKYNSLDSLLWPDALWKHSAPQEGEEATTEENSYIKTIRIHGKLGRGDVSDIKVNVCSKYIKLEESDITNNGTLGFFFFTSEGTPAGTPEGTRENSIILEIKLETKQPIDDVNLDKNQLTILLDTLKNTSISNSDGICKLDIFKETATIIPRGGNKDITNKSRKYRLIYSKKVDRIKRVKRRRSNKRLHKRRTVKKHLKI